MRLIFIQILICLIAQCLHSQDYKLALPKIGDYSYHCEHDGKIESFMLDKTSRNFWDFSFLNAYFSVAQKFAPPSNGKYSRYFKKASIALLKSNGEEEYLFVKNGMLFCLGEVIDAPYKSSGKDIIYYSPAKPVINTVLKKNQSHGSKFKTIMKYGVNDFALSQSFIPENSDSLLIEIDNNEMAIVIDDGYITFGNENMMSQKHKINVTAVPTFKLKNKGSNRWLQFEDIDIALLPDRIRQMVSKTTFTRIDYISLDFKGVALSYEVVNRSVSGIVFQNKEISPSSTNLSYDTEGIIAFPNPTFGNIFFKLFNYPADHYKLEVYNLVGHAIFTKQFDKSSGKLLKTDLSNLKRGTYMYSIFDSKGRKLITKRLSLISI